MRLNRSTQRRAGTPASTPSRRSNTPHLSGSSRRGVGYEAGRGSSVRSVSVSDLPVNRGSRPSRGGASGGPASLVLRILIGVAALFVVGALGFAVAYNVNLFPISKVTVSGSTHLTDAEITELAAVPAGSTLLNVDADGIESRLESNAWVKDATVERVMPDTINLKIEERTIAAVCDVVVDESATVQTWALSEDGLWLMEIPDRSSKKGKKIAEQVYTDAESVLKISDVPYGSKPEAGTECTDANIANALGIVAGMTTELADDVKYVSAANSGSTTLILDNGIEIAFGDDSDIRDKERVCLELMEKYPDQIAYINVRTVSNPIWRSAS